MNKNSHLYQNNIFEFSIERFSYIFAKKKTVKLTELEIIF